MRPPCVATLPCARKPRSHHHRRVSIPTPPTTKSLRSGPGKHADHSRVTPTCTDPRALELASGPGKHCHSARPSPLGQGRVTPLERNYVYTKSGRFQNFRTQNRHFANFFLHRIICTREIVQNRVGGFSKRAMALRVCRRVSGGSVAQRRLEVSAFRCLLVPCSFAQGPRYHTPGTSLCSSDRCTGGFGRWNSEVTRGARALLQCPSSNRTRGRGSMSHGS